MLIGHMISVCFWPSATHCLLKLDLLFVEEKISKAVSNSKNESISLQQATLGAGL
jgi:hypothetical protein